MELIFDPKDLRLVAQSHSDRVDLFYEPGSFPRSVCSTPFSPPSLFKLTQEEDLEKEVTDFLLKPPVLDLPCVIPDVFELLKAEVHPPCIQLKAVRDLATGEIKGLTEVIAPAVSTEVNFEELLCRPPGFEHDVDFDKTTAVIDTSAAIKDSRLDNLQDMLASLPDLAEVVENAGEVKPESEKVVDLDESEQLDRIPEVELSEVLHISDMPAVPNKTKWAEIVDIPQPVTNYDELNPNPAYKWPFELDTFQKKAVLLMEKGENVFVSAHTSAGKTVVAEYAIALSRKHMTKAIYTSPIKTLSNEKFRDFRETFDEVGIVTGDVQINREASTLIMTTEILRSMLYNKASMINDLEWVIFDECHYINDAERGVVWEEVLIMLPQHVNLVLLSATVPNALSLADWIGRIKQKRIHVMSTTKRPVPLEHYLYVGRVGASKEQKQALKTKATPEAVKLPDQAVLILDSAGQFKSQNYLQVCAAKKSTSSNWRGPDERSRYMTLLQYLQKKDACPAILFTLSRKRCDDNAASLANVDMTTATEKAQIHRFIAQCTARLSSEDRRLPQVETLKLLLKNGIGVHHSGILPIMKEVVEMLFQRGLIKILFATETFAMGVNMPARTVVFDRVRKYDGCQFRDLLPAEYIQMAGRAGRRGKDTVGTVLIMIHSDVPDSGSLQTMMMGKPHCLQSKFKVTDAMILNLKAGLQRRVEDLMRESFIENENQSQIDQMVKTRDKLRSDLENIETLKCDSCVDIESCLGTLEQLAVNRKLLWERILDFSAAPKLLASCRVLVFRKDGEAPRLGIIASFNSKQKQLSVVALAEKITSECYWPASTKITRSENPKCELLTLEAGEILDLSTTETRIDVKSLATPKGIREAGRNVFEMVEQWSFQKLNIAKELKGADLDLAEQLQKANYWEQRVLAHSCAKCPLFESHSQTARNALSVQSELERVNLMLSEEGMRMMPEYHKHLAVLERLGYIEPNGPLKLKGRIARAMSSHEILLSELLVGDILIKCKPAELAALLSVFVYQGKAEENEEADIPEPVAELMEQFQSLALSIGKIRRECGFDEDPETYLDQYNRGLVNVVYNWANGMTFGQIMQIAENQQEGTIVRCIQRLDELLGHVRDAAKVIGNPELHGKVEQASILIRRDIVFAASLYLE